MAKKKDKDEETPEGKPVGGVVVDHGLCRDCDKVVDVVVDIHQASGGNAFICVDCRCKRILQKAKEMAGGIQEDAKAARAEARQLGLPLKA